MITELNGGIAHCGLWPTVARLATVHSPSAAEKRAVNIPTNPPAVIRGTALLLYYHAMVPGLNSGFRGLFLIFSVRVRAEIRFSGGIPATHENWPQGPRKGRNSKLRTDGLWHSGPSKKTESQERPLLMMMDSAFHRQPGRVKSTFVVEDGRGCVCCGW